jgi:hypothetical protein
VVFFYVENLSGNITLWSICKGAVFEACAVDPYSMFGVQSYFVLSLWYSFPSQPDWKKRNVGRDFQVSFECQLLVQIKAAFLSKVQYLLLVYSSRISALVCTNEHVDSAFRPSDCLEQLYIISKVGDRVFPNKNVRSSKP